MKRASVCLRRSTSSMAISVDSALKNESEALANARYSGPPLALHHVAPWTGNGESMCRGNVIPLLFWEFYNVPTPHRIVVAFTAEFTSSFE